MRKINSNIWVAYYPGYLYIYSTTPTILPTKVADYPRQFATVADYLGEFANQREQQAEELQGGI